jgi:hypothetical protein
MNAAVLSDNQILLPPARIVQGDLYEPQTEDMQGNPLTVKSGQNAGQSRVNYFFAVAIPKAGEQAWWQTQWGARILQLAQGYWPQGQTQLPRFAWKIADGDDATPNPEAQMRKNCDREGFPGHWIVRCGSGFATKVYDDQGNVLAQAGLVKRGFWVETLITVNTNNNPQKPGIYINHNMVFYRAPGKEIVSGPDPRQVGAGRAALPAGVTAQPLGNTANVPNQAGMPAMPGVPGAPAGVPQMPGVPGGVPAMPGVPGAPVGVPQMPGQMPGVPAVPGMPTMPSAPGVPGMPQMPQAPTMPSAPAGVPVQPHGSFMQPPGAPGAMPAIPSAPTMPAPAATPSVVCQLGAPMGFKMANLNGGRYEAFKAQGWNDQQLLQAGHMVKL